MHILLTYPCDETGCWFHKYLFSRNNTNVESQLSSRIQAEVLFKYYQNWFLAISFVDPFRWSRINTTHTYVIPESVWSMDVIVICMRLASIYCKNQISRYLLSGMWIVHTNTSMCGGKGQANPKKDSLCLSDVNTIFNCGISQFTLSYIIWLANKKDLQNEPTLTSVGICENP